MIEKGARFADVPDTANNPDSASSTLCSPCGVPVGDGVAAGFGGAESCGFGTGTGVGAGDSGGGFPACGAGARSHGAEVEAAGPGCTSKVVIARGMTADPEMENADKAMDAVDFVSETTGNENEPDASGIPPAANPLETSGTDGKTGSAGGAAEYSFFTGIYPDTGFLKADTSSAGDRAG